MGRSDREKAILTAYSFLDMNKRQNENRTCSHIPGTSDDDFSEIWVVVANDAFCRATSTVWLTLLGLWHIHMDVGIIK